MSFDFPKIQSSKMKYVLNCMIRPTADMPYRPRPVGPTGYGVHLLMFCRVITAQVDYIIALGDKDNLHKMQEKEILCKRVASPSPATSHLGIVYALTHIFV